MEPNNICAKDAADHVIPVVGQAQLKFSCLCQKHRGEKGLVRTTLVLHQMSDSVLLLFELSVELDLVLFNCEIRSKIKQVY